MKKDKCAGCSSVSFEKVDITPAGCSENRFFVRCRQCGLVSYSSTAVSQSKPDKLSLLGYMHRFLGRYSL
ncbi:MAG: hypothetical protein E6X17_07500 [Sporomusaceae bacterium]|nr:hypothetical protein [Sporomusaceae bacterium]